MPKIHLHDEQFDGHPHSWCGVGKVAVVEKEFEATPMAMRCSTCDREWFPNGQPAWHFEAAVKHLKELRETQ